MSLKKFLRSWDQNKGQVVIEYFILLTVLAFFTILGGSYFFNKAQYSTEQFRNKAIEKMAPGTMDF
jgi:uncharacterized protein (UPF0333 family)